jgi:hypothetical protein
MKSAIAESKGHPAWGEPAPPDIEQECELWDWARAAGVSAADLRKAVRDSLGGAPPWPTDYGG